jgi:hypothetical protein
MSNPDVNADATTADATAADAADTNAAPAPAAAAPAAQAAPAVEDTAISAANWRSSIEDADLHKVAERYNSPSDMAKAVSDFRKQVSAAIRLPGKDANAEEMADFRKKLGVPDDSTGYKFARPEVVDEESFKSEDFQARLAEYAEKFHSKHLSSEQANGVMEMFLETELANREAVIAADAAYAAESMAALKKEWPGDEYERNTIAASRAAEAFLGEDYSSAKQIESKDGRLILDNPAFVKAFAKIGREMGEDRLGPTLSETDKGTIQDQIRDASAKKFESLSRGDKKGAADWDQKERTLIEKLSGSVPIVGEQGRAA